jgi:2-keto-4-pentenoate hydratase/2-oxohepta-3-ene-1,7-dioic acid hydratase in catechol pathway
MRLATFADQSAKPRFGIVRGDQVVDVEAAANALHRAVPATTVKIAMTSGAQTIAALEDLAGAAERAKLLRPIGGLKFLPPIPDPSKFFCVGKNNRKHREELAANKMLTEVPNEPTGFIKLVSTMSGDGDEVVKPNDITTLDYEPELCYVVGKRAHGVRKTDAMDYISGFTLTNDVSAREIQQREVASGSRFWTAKNMPGFAPVGPYILTMDEVTDTDNLWVTCDVNGKRRLRSNTGNYLYKIADVLAHFSRYVVFEPGDLIAMGAPSGRRGRAAERGRALFAAGRRHGGFVRRTDVASNQDRCARLRRSAVTK